MNLNVDQRLVLTILVLLGVYLWFNLMLREHPGSPQATLYRVLVLTTGALVVAGALALLARRRRR